MTDRATQQKKAASAALNILLVEDEPDAREAIQLYLEFLGYAVQSAANAEQALSAAEEFQPQVAICDWRIEGERDGVDVGRELKARYQVELIFVTAYPRSQLKTAVADLDVAAIISKPLSLPQLATTLKAIEEKENGAP